MFFYRYPEAVVEKLESGSSTGLDPFHLFKHYRSFESYNRYEHLWYSSSIKVSRPADNPEPEGEVKLSGKFRIEDSALLKNQSKIWLSIAVEINGVISFFQFGFVFLDNLDRKSFYETRIYVTDQKIENMRFKGNYFAVNFTNFIFITLGKLLMQPFE